jgi:transposase
MSSKVVCSECIKKQEEIFRLREELKRVKAQLLRQERKMTDGYFGSSTPSSKKPVKSNIVKNGVAKKRGGAKSGHKGNGRQSVSAKQADRVEEVNVDGGCPKCGSDDLAYLGRRERTVIEYIVKKEKVVYQLERSQCKGCGMIIQAKAPGVSSKNLLSNNLLGHVATEHYVNGIRLGHLERQTGVNVGSLIQAMHQLSRLFKDVPDRLIQDYRTAAVKHADETGWRNDGQNGYGWIFVSKDTCIFRFRNSRAGQVAQDVFGDNELPGVLIVDRYAGYNKSPCLIQYCYAHLLRHVQDLQKEFPDNEEVNKFVQAFAPLLAEAMNLRSLPITDNQFYKRAKKTKDEIMKIVNSQANHFGIQNIQNIFRDNQNRLYHWADTRDVPADNNFAERELRPLVMARKVSFGSHSETGVKTREVLMTILRTLKMRIHQEAVKTTFVNALNRIAENPKIDAYTALFNGDDFDYP